MSGLWLENGLHLNITYEGAKEIAGEIKKNGYAMFAGSKVKMVLPTKKALKPIKINQGNILSLNDPST